MEEASQLANRYWTENDTGRYFHVLADDDHPNEITANDIAAVSMLSVEVPAAVTIWLLTDDGRSEISERLARVPTDVDIWDAPELLERGGDLWSIWERLNEACWPAPKPGNKMGPTTISKLMATKRPRLVPVWDTVVAQVMRRNHEDAHWAEFANALADDKLRLLLSIASVHGTPEDTTFLRRLDAMLWMIGKHHPDW